MNKKIVIVVALFVLSFAGSALAGNLPATSDSFKYNLSSNVSFDYISTGTYIQYTMTDKHKAGNRLFSSSNESTKLWFLESEDYIGETITDTNSSTALQSTEGATDTDYSSWTAL